MSREQVVIDKMSFVLKKDELERVSAKIGEDGKPFIILDMHGWCTQKAKDVLDKTILINREEFNLDLVHGYRHGTAIKSMLQNDYKNSRVIKMRSYNENPGLTFIKIAEAM